MTTTISVSGGFSIRRGTSETKVKLKRSGKRFGQEHPTKMGRDVDDNHPFYV